MSIDTPLPGLDGRKPLGFLASLGVQAAFTGDEPPTLHWNVGNGTPILCGRSLEDLVGTVVESYGRLVAGPAMSGDSLVDDLKFSTPDLVRGYLETARSAGELAASFAAAQVSEGAIITSSKNNKGRSKPSALHFTGGKMKFLEIARAIAGATNKAGQRTGHPPLSCEAVEQALTGPGNALSLLRWGEADGRVHALCATSPAEGKELRRAKRISNPTATALGLLGMTRYPTWTSNRNRAVTRGFFGDWPYSFVWPLWKQPAGMGAVGSLLAQAHPDPNESTVEHYAAWGVSAIWTASIHGNGRYLSFGGPKPVWHAS